MISRFWEEAASTTACILVKDWFDRGRKNDTENLVSAFVRVDLLACPELRSSGCQKSRGHFVNSGGEGYDKETVQDARGQVAVYPAELGFITKWRKHRVVVAWRIRCRRARHKRHRIDEARH